MCGAFHTSVRHMSDRFYAELNRHNYVTPTSYLALIWTFKSLLTGKRDEILNLKTRYEMGLGKLEFASNQVGAMQNELTELRPKLLETSDETERLMIKIEQDTIQVEAKKEIVACDEALANEAAAAAQVWNVNFYDFYTDVNFLLIITTNLCFMSFKISKKKERNTHNHCVNLL